MKLDHEVLQRNYQKAVEYVKTHYADVRFADFYKVYPFDSLTQMESEIKGSLFVTVKNGILQLGRNTSGNDLRAVIKIIDTPTDIDIVNFLGQREQGRGGWQVLKQWCDEIIDNYHFATNFDPSKSRE